LPWIALGLFNLKFYGALGLRGRIRGAPNLLTTYKLREDGLIWCGCFMWLLIWSLLLKYWSPCHHWVHRVIYQILSDIIDSDLRLI
jgi:hypothetical protein